MGEIQQSREMMQGLAPLFFLLALAVFSMTMLRSVLRWRKHDGHGHGMALGRRNAARMRLCKLQRFAPRNLVTRLQP